MTRVMVVEDEDVLLEMIASLIEELGYHPITATNGQEALALLTDGIDLPALIISDIMMPRMNGVDFARAVKDHPKLRSVPVILMSAAGRPRSDLAADYFIPKPFELDKLATLIDQYINTKDQV